MTNHSTFDVNSVRRGLPRRGVLTLVFGAGASLITACSGGDDGGAGGRTSGRALNGADRLRAETKTLAPASYVKTYRVDPSGADGAFKTVTEAITAVLKDKSQALGVGGNTVYPQSNIWDWRCIEIAPGRYKESLGSVPPHTAFIGKGAKAEDVYIYWDGRANTLDTSGRSVYVANLHLDQTNMDADVHSMHDGGSAGDVGLQEKQRRTVVLENVRISTLEAATLAKGTNDMVPNSSVTMVFHRCTFDGPGQPQAISLVTNHGPGTVASSFIFIGCKVISNHAQHLSAELRQVQYEEAAPIGVVDSGKSRGDVFVWMDGTWDVRKDHGVQGLIVSVFWPDTGAGAVKNSHATTSFHLVNPGALAGVPTILNKKAKPSDAVIPDTVALPKHAVSAGERAFFGSQPTVAGQVMGTGLKPAGTLAVAKGDTYWIRVPLDGKALALSEARLAGSGLPGHSAFVYLDQGGKPELNAQVTAGAAAANLTVTTFAGAWIYPGQTQYAWVGLTFAASGEVAAVNAETGTAYRSAGVDPGVPVRDATKIQLVAAGQPVPAVELFNKRPGGGG